MRQIKQYFKIHASRAPRDKGCNRRLFIQLHKILYKRLILSKLDHGPQIYNLANDFVLALLVPAQRSRLTLGEYSFSPKLRLK